MVYETLPWIGSENCRLFADDTTIYCTNKNVNNLSSDKENDRNILVVLCEQIVLSVQTKSLIVFLPKHNERNGDVRIFMKLHVHHITSSVKFLRVRIDDGLGWAEHINHVVKRISSGSSARYSAKKFLPTDNLIQLYHSFVHSHLSKGTVLWGAACQYRSHKLDTIKKDVCEMFGMCLIINTQFHYSGN